MSIRDIEATVEQDLDVQLFAGAIKQRGQSTTDAVV